MTFCGAAVEIPGGKRWGCVLMSRHDGPHKALASGIREVSADRPEGPLAASTGNVVLEWFDKTPMFATCVACHSKLHWNCLGGWRNADGDHMCNCGCEAAA